MTCSPACRQKAYRQRRAEPLPAPPEQAGPSADTLWMLMLVQILGIGDGR